MQQKQTMPVSGKYKRVKRMSILTAIGIYIVTILGMIPALLAFNETDNFMITYFGLGYLWVVFFFMQSKYGAKWTDMVSRANDRIFGKFEEGDTEI